MRTLIVLLSFALLSARAFCQITVTSLPSSFAAVSLSGDGQTAVGYHFISGNSTPPAVWSAAGGIVDIPANIGEAFACSVHGDFVVGMYQSPADSENHAFLWSAAGGFQALNDGGAIASFARGVSDDGTVVAGYLYSGFDQPCEWVNGVLTLLPFAPGMTDGDVFGITADGTQAAGAEDNGSTEQMALFGGGGVILSGDVSSPFDSFAYGIARDGSAVVGISRDTNPAFWTGTGGLQLLTTLTSGESVRHIFAANGSTIFVDCQGAQKQKNGAVNSEGFYTPVVGYNSFDTYLTGHGFTGLAPGSYSLLGCSNDATVLLGQQRIVGGYGTFLLSAPYSLNDLAVAPQFFSTPFNTALNQAAPGALSGTINTGSAVLVMGTSHAASFTLNADGSFSYLPAAGFTGIDTFTFEAQNATQTSNVATATIDVAEHLAVLHPASIKAGSPNTTLVVTGVGFTSTSTIDLSGFAQPTTFISSTKLSTVINSGYLFYGTTYPITVVDSYGVASNSRKLSVTNPVPTITSISPTSVVAGSGTFTLFVYGTNFVATSTVKWNGKGMPTAYVSAGELEASVPSTFNVGTGTALITVVNSKPAGGVSNTATITKT